MHPTVVRAIRAAIPRRVRGWLRDPRQTSVWMTDQLRFAFGRVAQVELLPGWVMAAHPLALRRAFAPQLGDHAQRLELEAFARGCEPGMHLVDVGAHFGVFSLAALHFGGPSARALAVDPSPFAIAMIERQAKLNDVGDRLMAVQACVSNRNGSVGMLDTGVIGAGYFVPADDRPEAADLSVVDMVTVDELCRTRGFTATHLKVDVEGAELEVLQGAAGVLQQQRPTVSLELHNAILRASGRDPGEVVRYLQGQQYACDDVQGSGGLDSATFARDVTRITARPVGSQLPCR
jgi:FkbM family methyltransferase